MTAPATSMSVTERQRAVYDALVAFSAANGRSPTRRELARAINYASTGHLQVILKVLKARGLIDWSPGAACSIKIVQQGAGYQLPPDLQRRLEGFCAEAGERPLAFIADAVALQLDYAEAHADEIRGGGATECHPARVRNMRG